MSGCVFRQTKNRSRFRFRLCKKNLQAALNSSSARNSGWMKSLIRKHLLDVLLAKNDDDSITVRGSRGVELFSTKADQE